MNLRSWSTAVALVPLLIAGTAGAAVADDVSNNLDATLDAVAETMPLNVGGPNGTTSLYVTPRSGDGKNGCNLTGGTSLTLALSSSNPGVATVSPSSVTFTSCGDTRQLTVTPVSQGTTTVSATQTANNTGGTFNLAPVTFTVNVAPPANTAPRISVSGVAGGQSYAKGSVPDAWCDVTDTEDGSSRFPATLSAVSGPYAGDGIGNQTADCSYTDGGGLTAASAETYGIVDPTAPQVGHSLNAADGDNGWHRGDAALIWSVEEPESPSSVEKSGCVDQTITVDQPATDYTCSATSAGGTSDTRTVTIKRDATAPTGVAFTGGPAADTSYYPNNVPAAPTCTADDATSGLADCTVTGYSAAVGTHTVTATATDRAGNVSTATRTYTVRTLRINGFTSPVDMGRVVNTVKAGSTVPMKFEVFDDATELQDVAKVKSFAVRTVSCLTSMPEDAIEVLTTGGTSLRYDPANGGQYIQNWKTPSQVGKCYEATMTTEDDSSVSALFRLR